ncbi:hypothetical protein DNTS_032297, partial [Danionella cerebrum]
QSHFPSVQDKGVSITLSNPEVLQRSRLVFLAVKPHIIPEVLQEISGLVSGDHIIVSMAAGITLQTLEQLLPSGSRVVRMMPNLPCVLLEGAVLLSCGSCSGQEDEVLLKSLLGACGAVDSGPEPWIDAHVGLSGSGVAFVYVMAEALADGAVKMGMPSALARRMAAQTVLGAGALLRDSGKLPAELRAEVCTPGGTTIHGLHALEKGGFRAAVLDAVEAATQRAQEMGRQQKMLMTGTECLALERIWFEKPRYDEAERRFYEQMNVHTAVKQDAGANSILQDIARARENIQKSLAGSPAGSAEDYGELATRLKNLELENQTLRKGVEDLRSALSRMESRVSVLEKRTTTPSVNGTAPQKPPTAPQKEEEDEEDELDLFGSEDEEDEEAERLKEQRLQEYAAKKAKKPALVAKSSILLDVKPWDDETDMSRLEECVRSVQVDGLLWGASKLMPVGYGIKKLQISCVVEDDKVGTDFLEEEITKFEDYVQSVDVAAFNKI